MNTLVPLLNRDGKFQPPADGWYQLAPIGEFAHSESGLLQVLDRTAITSMVNSFRGEALLDFDHFSYDPDKKSEAAGWISELQARGDGLWGRIRWTDIGEESVRNGRYRYLSPVWMRADVESLGDNRVRPLRLDSAGLTNQPNLRGLAPLTNRAAGSAQTTNTKTHNMKSIATRLGLSPDSDEAAIVGEIDKLVERAETAEKQLRKLTKERDDLKNRAEFLTDFQAESDLDQHGIVDEAARRSWKSLILANRETALAALGSIRLGDRRERTPITNRQTAKLPQPGASRLQAEDDPLTAKKIANRAQEIQRTERCGYGAAWHRAKGEFIAA